MRLSREKMMQLSHVAIGYLKDEPMVEFFTDPGATCRSLHGGPPAFS